MTDGELVGQIGDGDADHAWWGRPEEMTMNRSHHKDNNQDHHHVQKALHHKQCKIHHPHPHHHHDMD